MICVGMWLSVSLQIVADSVLILSCILDLGFGGVREFFSPFPKVSVHLLYVLCVCKLTNSTFLIPAYKHCVQSNVMSTRVFSKTNPKSCSIRLR